MMSQAEKDNVTIQAILGNQAIFRLLTALVAGAGFSLCLAQNTSGVSGNPEPATADTATITSPGKAEIQPAANEQKNVHLEVGTHKQLWLLAGRQRQSDLRRTEAFYAVRIGLGAES